MDGNTIKRVTAITRIEDDGSITCIPKCEGNTDYQAYLEWKAIDGNEPEAAD